MVIKLAFLILFCASCGVQVKVPTTLKDASLLKNDSLFKSGMAQKNPKVLYFEGKTLPVSEFSSKGALKFYDSLTNNAQVPVKFIGGIGTKEVILEEIKKAP